MNEFERITESPEALWDFLSEHASISCYDICGFNVEHKNTCKIYQETEGNTCKDGFLKWVNSEVKLTAKEYLMQISKIDKYIEAKEAQKRKIRSRLEYRSNKLSKEPKSTLQGDKLCDGVSDIVDLQIQIDERIDKSIELQKKISNEIELVKDNVCKAVLIRRYLNCEDWEDIAKNMRYSFSGINKIHQKALQSFERVHKSV